MTIAVCDPEAFYPLRRLVNGPFVDSSELLEIERFVRTVVLHDEIAMELEPFPYDPDSESEMSELESNRGARNVVVAVGPILKGYDFFSSPIGIGHPKTPEIDLAPNLIEVARRFANAEEGNVYYEAHINYLKRVVNILHNDGSALFSGEFGSTAIAASNKYPSDLFKTLDKDWQQFAQKIHEGELGFQVPPVLSIVLSRCARREAIPIVIRDLRDEWATARTKVWNQIRRLKKAQFLAETIEIERELEEASKLFSPFQQKNKTKPIRVLWELFIGGLTGAVIANVSGGDPKIGAAVGVIGKASDELSSRVNDLGSVLFGRGAFDLARRVRKETLQIESSALARLLTEAEKQKLGL
jgi:antitoxin component of RelBE/YafQ-DinJ toxin-antitoxin module